MSSSDHSQHVKVEGSGRGRPLHMRAPHERSTWALQMSAAHERYTCPLHVGIAVQIRIAKEN